MQRRSGLCKGEACAKVRLVQRLGLQQVKRAQLSFGLGVRVRVRVRVRG